MCGLSTVVTPAGASLTMYREIRSYANSIWDDNNTYQVLCCRSQSQPPRPTESADHAYDAKLLKSTRKIFKEFCPPNSRVLDLLDIGLKAAASMITHRQQTLVT